MELLKHVGELLNDNFFMIENIDATIIAQAPKMRPHIDIMRQNIADALGIDISQINVKATTEEGLGFTGSGAGISSQAICMLNSPLQFATMEVDENGNATIYWKTLDEKGNEASKCEGCKGCSRK